MKCPILILACAFALGVLAGQSVDLLILLPVCAGCLLGACFAFRSNRILLTWMLVLAGFAFAGAACARLFQVRFPANDVSHMGSWGIDLTRPVLLEGTLATSPLLMPYGLQFDLRVTQVSDGQRFHPGTGDVRLRVLNGRSPVPAAALHLHYGEAIRAWARLQRPRNDQNPGSFDYRRWMESIQDIYWQGIVAGPQAVQKTAGPAPPLAGRLIVNARARLIESIDRLYPPWSVDGRDGAVLKAILLGDRSSLDSSTIEDFRKSGLYHLLVVAGLHVGLLVLLAEGLLRLLRLREAWRTPLLLVFLCIYALLVEQRAPTLRASLMIGAYLLARLLDREQPALNAVGIAALILLFHRPAWLFDSGFQLSFAAALLIAGVAVPVLDRTTEPYRRALWRLDDPDFDLACEQRAAQFSLDVRSIAGWLSPKHRLLGKLSGRPEAALKIMEVPLRAAVWIIDLVIFSAILQFGLILPMAEIFHRVTLAGIGLNALAVPLMTVLLAVAVPVVFLGLMAPALAALPAKLLSVIMTGLFGLTELRHMPQWLSFRVPEPRTWVAVGFVLAVMMAAFTLHRSRKISGIAGVAAVVFGLLIALYPFRPTIPKGLLEVTELDCGGGEGLFIVLPGQTTVLVGSGGGSRRWLGGSDPLRGRRWDPGENIVSPYLWSRGIKTIDVLILPDAAGDHLSGVPSLLRNFRVKQFWYGSLPSEPERSALLGLLRAHGVASRQIQDGGTIRIAGTRFNVLWPASDQEFQRGRPAGAARLLRISNDDGSVLLAADLSRAAQGLVLRENAPMASEVLQASPGELNPQFLSRARPAVVLQDPGERRKSKEPSISGAPKSLQSFNVSESGAVTISLHHGEIAVHSYLTLSKPAAR
ncbi:MAG: ComEC/Rec2 family competence protein [Terriglobia bacterium]